MRILLLAASLCVGLAFGQSQSQYPTTTPVPILKQINRHNEDGSYSYGFEAADGSYKIESKYPNGEVHGKYGFVDDTGNVREIEYGATSRRGFEPAGTGINVPPPTVNGNSIAEGKDDPEDDGQYREDPSIYYTDPKFTNGERYDPVPKTPIYNHQLQQRPLAYSPATPSRAVASAYRPPAPAPAPAPTQAPAAQYQIQYQQPQYQQPQYQQPQYQPQYQQPQQPQYQQPQYQQPQYQQPQYQQPQYQQQYQQEYRPQYKTLAQRQLPAAPQYRQPTQYHGQPAASGSYSINYKR